jgi:hypothetical protein
MDKNTINTVLRKFKANPRSPRYLNNPKYAHLTERNQEIYLSSAGMKWHWSYAKFRSFFNSMMNGKKYFLCDLPYQLTIKDGLRMREEVLDEMSEDDFDPIALKLVPYSSDIIRKFGEPLILRGCIINV